MQCMHFKQCARITKIVRNGCMQCWAMCTMNACIACIHCTHCLTLRTTIAHNFWNACALLEMCALRSHCSTMRVNECAHCSALRVNECMHCAGQILYVMRILLKSAMYVHCMHCACNLQILPSFVARHWCVAHTTVCYTRIAQFMHFRAMIACNTRIVHTIIADLAYFHCSASVCCAHNSRVFEQWLRALHALCIIIARKRTNCAIRAQHTDAEQWK